MSGRFRDQLRTLEQLMVAQDPPKHAPIPPELAMSYAEYFRDQRDAALDLCASLTAALEVSLAGGFKAE